MTPALVTSANSLDVLGLPWCVALDYAARLGVPVLRVRRKRLIRAAALLEALERHGAPAPEPTTEDARAAVLRALGRPTGLAVRGRDAETPANPPSAALDCPATRPPEVPR